MGGYRFQVHVWLVSTRGIMANASYHSIRFRTKRLQKNGTVRKVYECCQTEASSNNRKKPRMEPETNKKSRDTCQMHCFNCKGLLYVTLRIGHFNCVLKHHLNHLCYKDIKIPEKWCQYIVDNHKCGPMKVCSMLR